MESHKTMAEEDVAKIAAASTAAADKIRNLLSASDVDTLKHQQLLMYCFCFPFSSFCPLIHFPPTILYTYEKLQPSFFWGLL